jgi:hypothetical protein
VTVKWAVFEGMFPDPVGVAVLNVGRLCQSDCTWLQRPGISSSLLLPSCIQLHGSGCNIDTSTSPCQALPPHGALYSSTGVHDAWFAMQLW